MGLSPTLTPTAPFRLSRGAAATDIALWSALIVVITVAPAALGLKVHGGGWLLRGLAAANMIALFALSTVLLRRRGQTWGSVGLRRPTSVWRVVLLVAAGYVATLVVNGLLQLWVFPALKIARPALGAFGGLKGHPGSFAFWLVYAWTSAAVGEEMQFRGFLWARLERLFGEGRLAVALTMAIQAVLFGLGHVYQGLGGVLATGGIGLVMGGVYLAGRRNLVACMVLHALIDTISLTLLFSGLVPGT